jgi:glutathione S-transferase
MATPTLNHVPRTISSPIVQCLLELDLVDNPIAVHEINFSDLKTDEYLATFPMGTSPSFRDGDLILWESGAVLDYLLERYDGEQRLHPRSVAGGAMASSPEEVARRAKYLQLKQYIIATVYPFIASLFIHTLKPAEEQDPSYVASAKRTWTTLLGPVLTKWLGDGPYFLGDKVTAVDFLAAKPLNNCSSLGLLEDFPELEALLERIRSRPTFARAYSGLHKATEAKELAERSLLMVPPQ